jgi:hypothetical protein
MVINTLNRAVKDEVNERGDNTRHLAGVIFDTFHAGVGRSESLFCDKGNGRQVKKVR